MITIVKNITSSLEDTELIKFQEEVKKVYFLGIRVFKTNLKINNEFTTSEAKKSDKKVGFR